MENLKKEFTPILQKRGWRVEKLSELCCCFGGKLGKNPSVGGYCMPAGDGKRSRGIYLRLRSFAKGGDKFDAGHAITDYDSVANVMAHECAHIVHSKHSVEFYKLMDELFEEWRDGGGGGGRGFTVTGGGGRDINGAGAGGNSSNGSDFGGNGLALGGGKMAGFQSRELRRKIALDAAYNRQNYQAIMSAGGKVLGGVGCLGEKSNVDPQAAAANAAMRRQEDSWCQECQDLTFSDEEEEVEEVDEEKAEVVVDLEAERRVKRERKRKLEEGIIDLCSSSQEETVEATEATEITAVKPGEERSMGLKKSVCEKCTYLNDQSDLFCALCGASLPMNNLPVDSWLCTFCTVLNSNDVSKVRCSTCNKLRPEEQRRMEECSRRAIEQIEKKELVDELCENVKKDEVARATAEFGFNIYDSGRGRGKNKETRRQGDKEK